MSAYRAFGLNHETAGVEVRERFALDSVELAALYSRLGDPKGSEFLILSTCNRTEVYLYGAEPGAERLRAALADIAGCWPEEHTFKLQGGAAIDHVMEVVAGLRSQVLGDAQIQSQTKEAYRVASDAGTLGPWLHRLMHTAFGAAKRVTNEIGIVAGGGSIARAALHAALDSLEGRPGPIGCLLLGAGQMGRIVTSEAQTQENLHIILSNRTEATARRLAAKHGCDFVPWEARFAAAAEAHVVIGATASPEPVMRAADMDWPAEGPRPVFVDIAVPRAFDPDIGGHTKLLTIDDLSNSCASGRADPEGDVRGARRICREMGQSVGSWEDEHRTLQPAIQALYETFETVRRREVDRNLHRFSEQTRQDVERLTRSIMQKLLAVPVVRMKNQVAVHADVAEQVRLVNSLFSRPDCEEEREKQ